MAIPPRTASTGTFFITTVTYNRRRLFQVPASTELFLTTLQHYRAQGPYKLHAFVVMPDHVHLLLTPTGRTISQTMNLIKGGFPARSLLLSQSGNEVIPTTSSKPRRLQNPP